MARGQRALEEVEDKFDVPAAWRLPPLAGVGPVARMGRAWREQLEAVYFDTADRGLARAGIALRRRTGGSDEGWHLKLAKLDGARIEVQVPLGRTVGTPPAELRRLVAVHTGGRPLRAVATIVNDRRVVPLRAADDTTVAELVDDHVTGRASGARAVPVEWREVEVELVDGDRDGLAAIGAALIDAGAQRAGVESKLHRVVPPPPTEEQAKIDATSSVRDTITSYFDEQLVTMRQFDPRARLDLPDAVHKMRVAARRSRSALATFRRHLDRTVTDPLRDELRWLGQELGAARDAEVIRDHFRSRFDEPWTAELPGEHIAAARQLIEDMSTARFALEHERAVAALDTPRYAQLLVGLADVAAGRHLTGDRLDRRADRVLWKDVDKARRRLARDIAALGDHPDRAPDEALHEVRKAAKRLRYAAESVTATFGKRATKLASRAEKLQTTLGEHQDAIVTRELLAELARSPVEPGVGFVLGHLHGLERARGALAVKDAQPLLAALVGS